MEFQGDGIGIVGKRIEGDLRRGGVCGIIPVFFAGKRDQKDQQTFEKCFHRKYSLDDIAIIRSNTNILKEMRYQEAKRYFCVQFTWE